MENLKVGQSFEVVEVLTEGCYDKTFKVGGFTIAHMHSKSVYMVLVNGNNLDMQKHSPWLAMFVGSEVKPIGKLTITKLKC